MSAGSANRRIVNVELTDEIKLYDSLSFKHKNPNKTGRAKVLAEGFNGYEFSHHRKKMVAKERLIDREGYVYREIVTDIETGELIHQCAEPLSKHRNHGMAKRKPKGES
jgi:hypothetical protein